MKKTLLFAVALFITLLLTSKLNAQEAEKLLNGQDLSNWNFVLEDTSLNAEDVFSIRNGLIHIRGELGYMYTKKKYDNFHLHAEWSWPDAVESNSGIFLLIEDPKNPFPNGIECQLHAGDAGDFVLLGGSNLAEFKLAKGEKRPAFPVVKKAKPSNEKKAGEWNYADIYCRNGVIMVYINGEYQNKGTNKVKSGHVGLQSEGKDIQFKNVTLVPLL
ncbi:MAG: DUF1080 domain-containing protein [Prevotella sp.]|jgi:hypothetical protein|nr:DUF1080 domain-containing protein [Prevotella sp.]